jgi:pyruvyl transferase EpsO
MKLSDQPVPHFSPLETIRRCYAQALIPGVPTALLDFPDHSNVGDSAIWVGEMIGLREAGHDLRYTCDVTSFNEMALRRRMPFGQILLHGGGNFGTVWPIYQAFREAVIQQFPGYRIVQLPQTVHFENDLAPSPTRHRLSAHPDFWLMVRDRRSEQIAREQLKVPTLLCPDSALMLEGKLHRAEATVDVLVLARTDKEAGDAQLRNFELPQHRVSCIDWLDENSSITRYLTALTKQAGQSKWGGLRKVQQVSHRAFHALAWERLQRGVALLSRGRVVVTDRLHAHILCMILRIPHVVLDNNYGKLSEFIQCWHREDPLVQLVSNRQQAQDATSKLLAQHAV